MTAFLVLITFLHTLQLTYSQWSGYGGGYGYGNNPPPYPNNNLGIGYPTAYGLWLGRGMNGGSGWGNGWDGYGGPQPPAQGTGFGSALRCLNGGAHIGQCRLDKDSICIALGGSCIHGSCCTTPFVGLSTTTISAPTIEGEVTIRTKRPLPTSTVQSVTERGTDRIDSSEIAEWNSIVDAAKTSTQFPLSSLVSFTTISPEDEEIKQCESGLRAIGPCQDDDDCPSLHVCEKNICCYIV